MLGCLLSRRGRGGPPRRAAPPGKKTRATGAATSRRARWSQPRALRRVVARGGGSRGPAALRCRSEMRGEPRTPLRVVARGGGCGPVAQCRQEWRASLLREEEEDARHRGRTASPWGRAPGSPPPCRCRASSGLPATDASIGRRRLRLFSVLPRALEPATVSESEENRVAPPPRGLAPRRSAARAGKPCWLQGTTST